MQSITTPLQTLITEVRKEITITYLLAWEQHLKGLSVGLGVQPMIYLWETSNKVFDVPIVAKIGYDFRYFELAFVYKQGLSKTYHVSDFRGSRLSNWQFSVYIPLSKRH